MRNHSTHPVVRILISGLLFVALASVFGLATGQDQADETPVVSEEVESVGNPSVEGFDPGSVADVAAVVEDEPGVADFLLSGKYIAFLVLIIAGVVLMLGRWVSFWVRIGMMTMALPPARLTYSSATRAG